MCPDSYVSKSHWCSCDSFLVTPTLLCLYLPSSPGRLSVSVSRVLCSDSVHCCVCKTSCLPVSPSSRFRCIPTEKKKFPNSYLVTKVFVVTCTVYNPQRPHLLGSCAESCPGCRSTRRDCPGTPSRGPESKGVSTPLRGVRRDPCTRSGGGRRFHFRFGYIWDIWKELPRFQSSLHLQSV